MGFPRRDDRRFDRMRRAHATCGSAVDTSSTGRNRLFGSGCFPLFNNLRWVCFSLTSLYANFVELREIIN